MRSAASSATTADLVASCREGDERAWRALVRRYENLVYSTALNVGLDADDASEVHQRVWFELHRSLDRLQNPSGLPKWLIVTTRRLSYEHAVRARKVTNELAEDLVDPRPSSEVVIEELEMVDRLQRALTRMKRGCRDLLGMLFFEEPRPRYEEVAERLGVAVGSLGSMRGRCLERLRGLVEESS